MSSAYEKVMADNGLTVDQLSHDAKVGIREISAIARGLELSKKLGKKTKPETLEKLKTIDKWVVGEIIDQIEGTEKNEEEIPFTAEEVIEEQNNPPSKEEEGKKEEEGEEKPQKSAELTEGDTIESELKALVATGKQEFTKDDIRSGAPVAYEKLKKVYNAKEENGLKTPKYLLKEVSPGSLTFTIK